MKPIKTLGVDHLGLSVQSLETTLEFLPKRWVLKKSVRFRAIRPSLYQMERS